MDELATRRAVAHEPKGEAAFAPPVPGNAKTHIRVRRSRLDHQLTPRSEAPEAKATTAAEAIKGARLTTTSACNHSSAADNGWTASPTDANCY